MEKYFMHRIQKENGALDKGIEIHDTLDAAVLSFWGRLKLAYGKNPNITFMHCMITDADGNVVLAPDGSPYNMTWKAESETENTFFLHHIRLDEKSWDKAIDAESDFDLARTDFAAQMEYGYGNTHHPNVSFVSDKVTDLMSGGLILMDGCWSKAEPAPEPEPAVLRTCSKSEQVVLRRTPV